MRVRMNSSRLKPPAEIMKDLGLGAHGKVQQYATERVLFHMRKYMPWLTGLTATSLTQVTSPTTITVNAPYASDLYNGWAPSGNPLEYTKDTNEFAGPRWDQTMMQYEGDIIAQEIAAYARTFNGRS